MKQHNYIISDEESLKELLQSEELKSCCNFKTQFVQIYSAKNNIEWFETLGNAIRSSFPSAQIIGATSVGEIHEGKIHTNSTLLIFSFFESAILNIYSYECKPGSEEEIGKALIQDIESLDTPIKGMLLLSTPISNDSGKIFNIITENELKFPIFGGGAGDYFNSKKTYVYDGTHCYKEGVVMVLFSGDDLFIELQTYLEWQPLSKEMTITDVGVVSIKTIDDKPAFAVYQKYLGIKADENFLQNSMEFPLLINRNGQTIARTPFLVNEEDGTIQMVADVRKGEKFRIGYGNPQMILAESVEIQKKMQRFKPQSIFLFTCICRRFLMQEDVDLETLPFNKIAPTAGFYTFGEFCSNNTVHSLLNSTMVAVGFREGLNQNAESAEETILNESINSDYDPFINQHTRILSRLLYFINVTTQELEEQNKMLKLMNEQKNEFLGIAAHDLRNPIGVIQGFAGYLEDNISEELKQYTKLITKESSDMLKLLNNFLDISKIESGSLDVRLNEIDYILFVAQNVKMNEVLAQNKNSQIIFVTDLTSQILSIDYGKIDQVLNNLISNALKFSYPESRITVKVFRENDQIVTQVIDQGQGIPEREINEIFQPFKKTSIRPTSGEPSHGLGLAIVKKIIEEHNGQIGVTSEFGKGSTFFFKLPI